MTEVTTDSSETLVRGVYPTSWGNRWFAQVRRQGRRLYLGTFPTREEAARAIRELDEALGLRPS